MPSPPPELSAESLYRRCEPELWPADAPPDRDGLPLEQSRVREALSVGLGIGAPGYNLFVLGSAESQIHDAVRGLIEDEAAGEAAADDWCYVYNFETPNQPRVLRLPAGRSAALRAEMAQFVRSLHTGLVAAFESEEYQTRRQMVTEEFQKAHEEALTALREKAEAKGFAFLSTPTGFVFAPMREGTLLTPDQLQALPEAERAALEAEIQDLQEELLHILRQVPAQQRALSERIRELNRDVARYAVEDLIGELRAAYADLPAVQSHLDAVEQDVITNVEELMQGSEEERAVPSLLGTDHRHQVLRRYAIHPIVQHDPTQGAPVVYEDHPTPPNLTGRIDYRTQFGVLTTDFTLIQPGALHRANGGYLLLDARKLLAQPFSWEVLKRTLQAGEVTIQSPYEELGLTKTASIEPASIPLDVTVILLGERRMYYLLQALDPEFDELFRIEADADEEVDRTPETEARYAAVVEELSAGLGPRSLEPGAVTRLVEHASRRADDAEKLSTDLDTPTSLLREAHFWAGRGDDEQLTREHVEQALAARRRRAGRVREQVQEHIRRRDLLVDTEGWAVGQVNGLAVHEIGRDTFGQPRRITARVQIGGGQVLDIEREVELGGPLHSKGVLILSGFLGGRYATDRPLSLSGSLVFEQSYGGVEGDSASTAELYALLSAIAEVPLRQSLAVTGSVNQHGVVQPIGGVNEKIEGFFEVCADRGLTGEQGVLIPAANVKNLMLRADVVDAVREDAFYVYPVEHIDQGMERLTDEPMGERRDDGTYPPDTINGRIQERLHQFAEERAEFYVGHDETNHASGS